MKKVFGSLSLTCLTLSLAAALIPIDGCGAPLDILGADPSPRSIFCQRTVDDRNQFVVMLLLAAVVMAALWISTMFRRSAKPDGILGHLPEETVAWLDERAVTEELTVGNGEPDRPGMLWLTFAYAAWYMPKGWRPVDPQPEPGHDDQAG